METFESYVTLHSYYFNTLHSMIYFLNLFLHLSEFYYWTHEVKEVEFRQNLRTNPGQNENKKNYKFNEHQSVNITNHLTNIFWFKWMQHDFASSRIAFVVLFVKKNPEASGEQVKGNFFFVFGRAWMHFQVRKDFY